MEELVSIIMPAYNSEKLLYNFKSFDKGKFF